MVKYNFKGVYKPTPKKIEEESVDIYLSLDYNPEHGTVLHFVDKNGNHIPYSNLILVKSDESDLLYINRAGYIDDSLPILFDDYRRIYVE